MKVCDVFIVVGVKNVRERRIGFMLIRSGWFERNYKMFNSRGKNEMIGVSYLGKDYWSF